MMFGAVEQTVVQITQLQTFIGLAVFVFSLGAAWATLKASVKNVSETVNKIETNVGKIQTSMSKHKADITGLKAHTKYGVANSPIVPSEDGKRVLKDSGFSEQYPKMKSMLFEKLDAKKLRTLYDVEQSAFEVLKSCTADPLMDPMKDYAVNNPSEPLELILNIGSWVLRDDYATHKGIKVKHKA